MTRYAVTFTQSITVTVDKSKFTEKWMADFRAHMYHFHSIEEHVQHLGQLHARGLADNGSFIEGYGKATDMGIHFTIKDTDVYAVKKR